MNRYITIGDRQTGKSTLAVHEFMKDPLNNVILVNNIDSAKALSNIIREKYKVPPEMGEGQVLKRIFSVNSPGWFHGVNVENLIIDEFGFYKNVNVEEILNSVAGRVKNIHMFTSLHDTSYPQRKATKKMIKRFVKSGFVKTPKMVNREIRAKAHVTFGDQLKRSKYEYMIDKYKKKLAALDPQQPATEEPRKAQVSRQGNLFQNEQLQFNFNKGTYGSR